MYLLLNLAEKNDIHLALFSEKERFDTHENLASRDLLIAVDGFLKQQGVSTKDIQGMMIVVEAGSFTNTRLAVTLANTFAYVQQIPLLAVKLGDVDRAQELIPELLKQPKGQYISATYSGEANIGKKKV